MSAQFSPITAGIEIKSIDASTIRLVETIHPPGLQLAPHRHERPSIALVLKGSFVEQFEHVAHECNSGSVVIKPAEAVHSDMYGNKGARSLIIELFPNFFPLIPQSTPVLAQTQVFVDASSFITRRIYNEFSYMDDCSILSIEALILELLAHTIRENLVNPSKAPEWLKRARELINDEFKTSPDLKRIAHVAGVHPSHLARTFRKTYGCTVGEYLRELRLKQAMTDLDQSEKNITQISQDAGFYDQSHFVRCFKRYTGMSPLKYRRWRIED
jgi:AraC family transcriptional regulator